MKAHQTSAWTLARAASLSGLLASVLCLAFAASGCIVANPNHCVNRDADGNAWCKAQDAEKPFCNPCSGVNDGCQDTEPQLSNPRGENYCFDYVSPGTTSGAPPTTDSGDDGSSTDGDSSGGDSSGGDSSGGDSSGGDSSGSDSSGSDSSGG